jgi:hypothetical protein
MIALALLLGCPADTDDTAITTPTDPDDTATTTPTDSAETGDSTTVGTPCVLPPTAWTGDVCVESASCVFGGGQTYEYLGYALAAGGDADADGIGDLLLGAPGWDATDGTRDVGRARVLSGAGLATLGQDAVLGHLAGTWEYEYVGHDVAWVGDMTGDGVDDFVATARGYDQPYPEAGRVALVAGAAGGWVGWDLTPTASWTGATEYARAGQAVQALGDSDGDGLADLLVTTDFRTHGGSSEAYGGGGAAVLLGAVGLDAWDGSLADAAGHLTPEDTSGAAGMDLAAGDFDGDGVADAAIAAPYSSSYGRVYAVPGTKLTGTLALADAPVRWTGDEPYAIYGWRLAAGDFDGDGFDDLAIGVPLSDAVETESGQVIVQAGGPGFFTGESAVLATLDGTWDHQEAGTGLAAGDANGDGVDDLLLGAVTAWQGLVTKGGRVHLILGQAGGWTDTTPTATFHGAGTKDYLGGVLALSDLDGDGAAELFLGTAYANSDGTDSGAVYLFGALR